MYMVKIWCRLWALVYPVEATDDTKEGASDGVPHDSDVDVGLTISGKYHSKQELKLEKGTPSSEKAGLDVKVMPDPEITSNFSEPSDKDPEQGVTHETPPEEIHCNSGLKRKFKPHALWPFNADPHQGGDVKVKEVSSRVKLGTQMLLPAAMGCGGYIVVGHGAFYSPAFAFSVFGIYVIGILSMFLGWYMESNHPRVSEFMQILGQAICVVYLLLTQIPVSYKLI